MSEVQLRELPVKVNKEKTIRESAYVEPEFSDWLEVYATSIGTSRSVAMRRLMILGAESEGYVFDGEKVIENEGQKAAQAWRKFEVPQVAEATEP